MICFCETVCITICVGYTVFDVATRALDIVFDVYQRAARVYVEQLKLLVEALLAW